MATGFLNRTMTVEGRERHYMVYLPRDYEVLKPLPLILFLHGSGERGGDGLRPTDTGIGHAIRRHAELFPAVVVFPQCPAKVWWDKALASVDRALEDSLNAFEVDRHRLYLTGISMGGYAVWEYGARHPKLFAALMPICGGGREDDAAALATTPIWAFHGAEDPVVDPGESRNMVEAIRQAGGLIKYSELPHTAHNAWDAAYTDKEAMAWLFKQRKQSPGG